MYCSTLKDVFHHSIKAVVVLIVIKMVIGKVKKMLDVISRHPIEQLQLENNLPETKFKTPHSASL